jgi:hypothetical protein
MFDELGLAHREPRARVATGGERRRCKVSLALMGVIRLEPSERQFPDDSEAAPRKPRAAVALRVTEEDHVHLLPQQSPAPPAGRQMSLYAHLGGRTAHSPP